MAALFVKNVMAFERRLYLKITVVILKELRFFNYKTSKPITVHQATMVLRKSLTMPFSSAQMTNVQQSFPSKISLDTIAG